MISKNKVSYILLHIILFFTSAQFSSFGIEGEVYDLLRIIIIILILILFTLNIGVVRKIGRWSLTKYHTIITILLSVALFFASAFTLYVEYSPLRDLVISLIVLLIGTNIKLEERQYKYLVNAFVILYSLSAVSIALKYASGFVILDQYLSVPKNQIAPVFGTAFVASVYFIFNNAQKKGSQMIYYITAFLLFASLLVIRGRSVILGVFVSIIVFVFFYLKQRKYKYVLIFSSIIIGSLAGNFIYDALFLNYDMTDIESISTGRMSRNYEGFDFFISNPLMGQLSGIKYPGFTIHNYILYNLVNYGLFVGGLVLFLFYKYIKVIVKSYKINNFRYYDLGPLLMTLLFVVSLLEYTYPYAPGSAVFFTFFLMGQYLQKLEYENR